MALTIVASFLGSGMRSLKPTGPEPKRFASLSENIRTTIAANQAANLLTLLNMALPLGSAMPPNMAASAILPCRHAKTVQSRSGGYANIRSIRKKAAEGSP